MNWIDFSKKWVLLFIFFLGGNKMKGQRIKMFKINGLQPIIPDEWQDSKLGEI